MTNTVGLWIDHRKAVVVRIANGAETMETVRSDVERQPGRFGGVRSTARHESHEVPADDSQQRRFSGELADYYDRVVAHLAGATSILILGPGEAKGELAKRLAREPGPGLRPVTVETAGRMSEPQIAATVRQHAQGTAGGSRRASARTRSRARAANVS